MQTLLERIREAAPGNSCNYLRAQLLSGATQQHERRLKSPLLELINPVMLKKAINILHLD